MPLTNPSRATGKLFGPVGRSVKFKFFTDSHHDPIKATEGTKVYQDTEEKITALVTEVNARDDIAFVFQNGDWVDGSASQSAAEADLVTIQAKLALCNKPQFSAIGNHDVYRLTKDYYMATVGQPARWYSFIRGGVLFIVLDGNYRSDANGSDLENSAVTGNPGPYVSYIPPEQREWLEAEIAASKYPVVIMCHYPVYYSGSNSWGLTNGAAVRSILEAHDDKVIGCLGGHLHDNFVRRVNGILYANMHALVTGSYPSVPAADVTVYPDAMTFKIEASGVLMSHVEAGAV
jgi:hypothetical protein